MKNTIFHTSAGLDILEIETQVTFQQDSCPDWAADMSITQSNPLWFRVESSQTFLDSICEETGQNWELTFNKDKTATLRRA